MDVFFKKASVKKTYILSALKSIHQSYNQTLTFPCQEGDQNFFIAFNFNWFLVAAFVLVQFISIHIHKF